MEALSLSNADAAPALARGRYRLLEEIGVGGMATVYRGYDERLSRNVAVKVMKPDLASNPTLRARFVQEARTMARLDVHRHVVQIYDFGQDEDDHRLYIAMELLGRSLQHVLDRHGHLPPRLASELMIQVLEALELAHKHRIVHRDVKPSNILLTREGSTKVSDFGIARIMSPRDQARLTRTGAGVGTWAYMAPEQKRDAGTVDHRADLYAVGATLFALVTNKEPHDIDRPETWREQLEAIPEALRDVILRATRYQPEDRYRTAAELRAALGEALALLPPDPPGADALVAAGARTAPDPVAPITLVPPAAAPTPGSTPDTSQRSEIHTHWPSVTADPDRARLKWGTLILLALGVTGLAAWWVHDAQLREEAAIQAAADARATEEARLAKEKAEEAARLKAAEDARLKAEEEARLKAEEEARLTAAQAGATGGAAPEPPTSSGPKARTASPTPTTTVEAPPEAAVAPPVLTKVKLSVAGAGCKVLVDGKALLPGMRVQLEATGTNSGLESSAPQLVPVGWHSFSCVNGKSTQEIELKVGVPVPVIKLEPVGPS